MIVLDTSALILWLDASPGLSFAAREVISAADRRVISSISVWEIAHKVKQGRLLMRLSPEDLVRMLEQLTGFEIVAVDAQTWLDSVKLDWNHRDPADRVIVALAGRLGCPLVSSDGTIKDFYEKTIW